MSIHSILKFASLGIGALLCSACGGGDGPRPISGAGTLPPPPPPPPAAQAPIPFGLTADAEFSGVGEAVDIRWDAESRTYDISIADGPWQQLTYLSSPIGGEHYTPSSSFFYRIDPLDFEYSARVTEHENGWGYQTSQFAIGIPTAAGDVPITGTATYHADMWGTATPADPNSDFLYDATGDVYLAFNFAAGTLDGHMDSELTGPYGNLTLPRYSFTQTVFGIGETDFSGQFLVPGSTADSFFAGRFNGPGAAELIASFSAPFLDSTAPEPAWGTMSGIWIGRRN